MAGVAARALSNSDRMINYELNTFPSTILPRIRRHMEKKPEKYLPSKKKRVPLMPTLSPTSFSHNREDHITGYLVGVLNGIV